VKNYVYKCARYCPAKVLALALFEDIRSIDKLERAVHAVVEWKLSTLTRELWDDHCKYEVVPLLALQMLRNDTIRMLVQALSRQNVDPSVCDYFTAVIMLHVAYTTSSHSLTAELLETLWTLFDPLTVENGYRPMDTNKLKSAALLSIRKAIKLACLSNVRSNALEMLHNEMSKAYLHNSFAFLLIVWCTSY